MRNAKRKSLVSILVFPFALPSSAVTKVAQKLTYDWMWLMRHTIIWCAIFLVVTGAAYAAEAPYELAWTRQLGTSDSDSSRSVAIDGSGNAYISGYTEGSLGGPSAGITDAFLAKYDSAGSLLWTRQLGTSSNDRGYSVAIDGSGNAYISGHTKGGLGGGPTAGGWDAFLAKFDSSGTHLWTSQLGTSGWDMSYSVAVDGSGNAYISGRTDNGPISYPYNIDAFLAKYDSSGSLLWTEQLGTSEYDISNSVAIDGSGNAYISGWTSGSIGGPNEGSSDAFLAKYAPSGSPLWTRQLGTSSSDQSFSVAIDGSGNAYISGRTEGSLDGPHAGGDDAFLAKYNDSGSLLWKRQLGTSSSDVSYSVAIDGSGNAYISGETWGDLGGPNEGSCDAFLAKYDTSGSLLWTKQLGTGDWDDSWSVAIDGSGNAYISGYTKGSLGGPNAGGADAFLAKYVPGTPSPPPLVEREDPPPPSILTLPPAGQLGDVTGAGTFDPLKPTIVFTHDWNPDIGIAVLLREPGEVPAWITDMATEVADSGVDANVLWWDWTEAATSVDLVRSARSAIREGKELAASLDSLLGDSYDETIHFVGHRTGAELNTNAVDRLCGEFAFDPTSVQLTHLDPRDVLGATPWMKLVPDSDAVWVDSYMASSGSLSLGIANVLLTEGMPLDSPQYGVWEAIQEIAESAGYAPMWYLESIGNSLASEMGFRRSLEYGDLAGRPSLGTVFRQTPDQYDSLLSLEEITWEQGVEIMWQWEGAELHKYLEVPLGVLAAINGPIEWLGQEIIMDVLKREGGDPTDPEYYLQMRYEEASPVYGWLPVSIPSDAIFISFDFLIENADEGDYLTFGIGENLLFYFDGTDFEGDALVNSGYINISDWAGEDVELIFALNSGGDPNATMTIESIAFYSPIPEPSTLLLLAPALLGFAGLLRRRLK